MRIIKFIVFLVLVHASLEANNLENKNESSEGFIITEHKPSSNLFKLENVISKVLKQNSEILFEKIQVDIANTQIDSAKGEFETHFFIEGGKKHEYTQNNVRDAIVRNNADTYEEDLENIDMGIRAKSIYGTNWSLALKSQRKSSSLIDDAGKVDHEYESGLYLEVKQPLLKGFGKDIGETNINISKLKTKQAQEEYKKRMMSLMGNTIMVYWRLYSAIEIHKTWNEIINLAKQQEINIKRRVEAGNMSKVSLLEIQNSITNSKVEMLSAQDNVNKEKATILSLLNISVLANKQNIKPSDNPQIEQIQIPNLQNAIELASKNWIELNIVNKKLKQEKLLHKYAKNQLEPDLQFVGNINTHTLEGSANDAIDQAPQSNYISWYAGLSLSIPLQGNMQATSKVKQSQLKVNQILLEKKSLHSNLVNTLSSKIYNLKTNKQKMKELQKSLEFRSKMIDIYTEELKYGKIDVKDLTDAYSQRVLAKRKWLKGLMDTKLSEASLDMALGTLFEKYNININ
jgi:outer membrane protein TolC